MRFLEREVYAFLSTFDKRGERVRGAMLRARIFLFVGRPQKMTQGRAMDRPRVARAKSLRIEQYKKSDTREVRGKREEGYFSFS